MSDEEASDTLISVAQAIALGQPVQWDDHVRKCSPAENEVLEALQGLQRIASAHRRIFESPSTEFSRWAHLTIVERGERVGSLVRCRARDALGLQMALLLIGPLNGDTVVVSQLLKLARLSTTVHHPNLAVVHGADYAHDCVGLWYEDVPGDTLDSLTRAGTTFDLAPACEIVRDLARAQHALHSAGLAHGDVTPRTIMRTSDGRTVLLPSIVLGGDPEHDVAALRAVLDHLVPAASVRLRHKLARATTAAALADAIERSLRQPWWTNEWLIGFLSVAALVGVIVWFATR
jgi:hypothetical protein